MSKNSINTRVIDLTLGELLDAIDARIRETRKEDAQGEDSNMPKPKRFVYGLKGLQKLFGCSKTTASRIKASGKIDKAITQVGADNNQDAVWLWNLPGKIKGNNNFLIIQLYE